MSWQWNSMAFRGAHTNFFFMFLWCMMSFPLLCLSVAYLIFVRSISQNAHVCFCGGMMIFHCKWKQSVCVDFDSERMIITQPTVNHLLSASIFRTNKIHLPVTIYRINSMLCILKYRLDLNDAKSVIKKKMKNAIQPYSLLEWSELERKKPHCGFRHY